MDNLPTLTEMSPQAMESEIAHYQGMMCNRSSPYWKDNSVQLRYRDLVDRRDGRSLDPDDSDPGEDAYVASELAPVRSKEFEAANPGGDYNTYFRAVQQASDVVLSVPANERAALILSFNRLPDDVAGAISAELTNRSGTGLALCSDDEVRAFARENGGKVVREWGSDAPRMMGRVRGRLNRCMRSLDARGLERFLDWHAGLSDGQAAAVYRKLAQ